MDSRTFFRDIVEPLCDAFEPRYCDLYANLFSELLAHSRPGIVASDLLERYRRVRRVRRWTGEDPEQVVVLSRVTLGADVVVTSTVMDAVKRRFPEARVGLVGSKKSWEMFEADPRVEFVEAPYARGGSLEERLAASWALRERLPERDVLVVDPDSRLTQLGMVPVCDEEAYLFFESRSYCAGTRRSIGDLARQWSCEVFGVDAEAYVAPAEAGEADLVTVSLGVGENPEKGLGPEFERGLLEGLVSRELRVLVDYGAGEEEAARVQAAIEGLPVETWRGAFAPFASMIAKSRLYVGYDSAGQHVADVCGVPLVTVFAGYATERTFERWKPDGQGRKAVLRANRNTLCAVLAAVDRLITRV